MSLVITTRLKVNIGDVMNIFRNSFFLIVSITGLLFSFGCSKENGSQTSSTIKIVGANLFSAGSSLNTRANNGLLLYGKSSDGKSFAKKIDSNTVDMSFPNGTWNFYAVAWDKTAIAGEAEPGLMGKVSCAKSLGVILKGLDVVVNLNLSNLNCTRDFHPSADLMSTSGDYKFPNLSIVSCKNISGVNMFYPYGSSSPCDQADSSLNKGYATSYRIAIPEYNSTAAIGGDAFVSKCLRADDGIRSDFTAASIADAQKISFPLPGLNGFEAYVKVYYSNTPCDESNGFTKISLSNSPKQKRMVKTVSPGNQGTDQFFLEADAGPVCQVPRLSSGSFASGTGSVFLPYTICTVDQFGLINTNFSTGLMTKNKSFDLISDIDFGFNAIEPIGDNSYPFSGTFNGANHRINNLKISCALLGSGNRIGLFKNSQGAKFLNLTINKGLIDCNVDGLSNDNVGMLVGSAAGMTEFNNIKIFGHVSGDKYVGGIVGSLSEDSKFSDSHFEGGVNGDQFIGGLAGDMNGSSATTFMTKSSFKGELSAKCNVSLCMSYIGGLVGRATWTVPGAAIRESTAKIIKLDGSAGLGGLVGQSYKIDIFDSIASGYITSKGVSDGSSNFIKVGGLVGIGDYGNFKRNISFITRNLINAYSGDSTNGALLGAVNAFSPACEAGTSQDKNYALEFSGDVNNLACNSQSRMSFTSIGSATTYANYLVYYPMATTSAWRWESSDMYNVGTGFHTIPRLKWEYGREADIPYLKNDCLNNYDSLGGSGTAADPFKICTAKQVNEMAPNYFYALKKDIYFNGASVVQKPSGRYFLDGNGFSIINFVIPVALGEANRGLFNELLAGSEVKNLKLVLGKVSIPFGQSIGSNMSLGLVSGRNFGKIDNVTVYESSLSFSRLNFVSNPTSHNFSVGGLVGSNETSGVVTNSDINSKVALISPRLEDDIVSLASIVGRNSGVVKGIRARGDVERSLGVEELTGSPALSALLTSSCAGYLNSYAFNGTDYLFCDPVSSQWSSVYQISPDENIGSIVGYNDGKVSEVKFDGSLILKDKPSNTFGNVAPIVGVNTSNGKIVDLEITGSFNFQKYNNSNIDQVVKENNGTLARILFSPRLLSYFSFSGGDIFDGKPDNICRSTFVASRCFSSSVHFGTSFIPLEVLDGVSSVYSSYDWKVTDNFFAGSDYVWLHDSFDKNISLIKASGSFEKLGKGF